MHELGIVFHVIRAVEDIGRQQQLTDVASVTLELGQVSGVVPHELESCWKWAVGADAPGTAAVRDGPRHHSLRWLRPGL